MTTGWWIVACFATWGLGFMMAAVACTAGLRKRDADAVPEPVRDQPAPRTMTSGAQAVWQARLREAIEAAAIARRRVVVAVLPVLDDLERARAHSDLPAGVLQIIVRFEQALREVDVHDVGAHVGQPFNPHHHEAVSMVGGAAVGALRVIEVVRRGYADIGDTAKITLLRPALVVVARAEEA